MAVTTVAAAQGATNNGKTVAPASSSLMPRFPTNAPTTPLMAASASQPYAPIGGAFTPALMGRTRFSLTNPLALGGTFGVTPLGGNWYPGPVGGTMSGAMPVGGRLTNILVGGNFAPFSPVGGTLNGRPIGGQFGTNVLGGIRSPNYSFTAGSNGVIVGGVQQAGASTGGVLVGNSPVGGALATGNPPGGVIVGGAPPITNAPGGHLQ